MALAVTHIIVTILVLDLIRHYVFGVHRFPRHLVIIGGIAGLLPDIDIPLSWVSSFITGTTISLHGTFTHSFFFVGVALLTAIVLHYQEKNSQAHIFYVIAAGILMHLVLDCLYGGYKTFFWPWSVATNFCPQWGIEPFAASIDAIILVLWLVHEEVHKKVKDYF